MAMHTPSCYWRAGRCGLVGVMKEASVDRILHPLDQVLVGKKLYF